MKEEFEGANDHNQMVLSPKQQSDVLIEKSIHMPDGVAAVEARVNS